MTNQRNCNIWLIFFIWLTAIFPSANVISSPTVEWTYHKSTNGAHPDGNEQMLVWLMNRARQNPTAEGVWLATSTESDVAQWINWYSVNTTSLQTYFAGYPVAPPAAFDVRLYNAAHVQSVNLISQGSGDGCPLSHTGQFDAVDAAGFHWLSGCGSLVDPLTALSAHAGWNIDGNASGGGHRNAIMALSGCNQTSNVGIAAVPDTGCYTTGTCLCTTANYFQADTSSANHFNRFIVGTVWKDMNGNGRYDPNEGFGIDLI